MNVSLDGFIETPDHSLDWADVDEEVHFWFNQQTRDSGASIYGRRMYEVMTSYWPNAGNDPNATPAMRQFGEIWSDTPEVRVLADARVGRLRLPARPRRHRRRAREAARGARRRDRRQRPEHRLAVHRARPRRRVPAGRPSRRHRRAARRSSRRARRSTCARSRSSASASGVLAPDLRRRTRSLPDVAAAPVADERVGQRERRRRRRAQDEDPAVVVLGPLEVAGRVRTQVGPSHASQPRRV